MCDFPAKELIEAEEKWARYDRDHMGEQKNNNIRLLCTIALLGWNHEYSTGCPCMRELQEKRSEGRRKQDVSA